MNLQSLHSLLEANLIPVVNTIKHISPVSMSATMMSHIHNWFRSQYVDQVNLKFLANRDT